MIVFIWQWFSLPAMTADKSDKRTGVFRLLANPLVAMGLAACGLFFMGQFALFTYLRPFLERVTQVDITTLSLILLTIGVAGFMGTLVISAFSGIRFLPHTHCHPFAYGCYCRSTDRFWSQYLDRCNTAWFMGLNRQQLHPPVGGRGFARTLPEDAEAGGGLMVAIVQLSIALGSTIGGLAFDHSGYQSTFTISGILLVIAAALALLTSRKDIHQTQ
ncbi:Purine ribonucleoside efflux pump nepI [Serratia fonticola]|uniref:Purine ribonucleoside efflux pump nepI n=1 Tax=Serratia fonticola TaxID=47917 RepID=A0A4U9UK84_SERFO|nr:Purine ribonucleoside efflux pump nepI [Serratia fonticola]